MVELKLIDSKKEWEGFLRNADLPTSFFQSWNWGEFEQSLGNKVYRMGFYHHDELIGVGSAVDVNAKRGKFLHFRNGPVLRWEDDFTAKAALHEIVKFAKKLDKDFIRISPQVERGSTGESVIRISSYVDSQIHDVDAEITWMLDLTKSEEVLQEEMRKNTRYYIRKASRDGVEIIKTQDPEDIEKFWPIYEDTVKRQKWSAYSLKYLKSEFKKFVEDDMAVLFLAKYKGKYIAGAIFIYYLDEVYYHHSGHLTEYRKITAPYLIQWESILEAKKKGLKLYNFFGIAREDNPNHPWYGLTFFKKGFGGYERRWIHAKDRPLKLKYWVTNFYERLERTKRGY